MTERNRLTERSETEAKPRKSYGTTSTATGDMFTSSVAVEPSMERAARPWLAVGWFWGVGPKVRALQLYLGIKADGTQSLIAGQPVGIYTRLSAGATDPTALSVPTLVAERGR